MAERDPFFRDVKSFFPPVGSLFKRRGSWFGLSVRANAYGASAMTLSSPSTALAVIPASVCRSFIISRSKSGVILNICST